MSDNAGDVRDTHQTTFAHQYSPPAEFATALGSWSGTGRSAPGASLSLSTTRWWSSVFSIRRYA
jgi:hypothetical protein